MSRTTREPNTGGRRRPSRRREASRRARCHPAAGRLKMSSGRVSSGGGRLKTCSGRGVPSWPGLRRRAGRRSFARVALERAGEGILEEVLDDVLASDCSWLPPLSDSKLNRGPLRGRRKEPKNTFLFCRQVTSPADSPLAESARTRVPLHCRGAPWGAILQGMPSRDAQWIIGTILAAAVALSVQMAGLRTEQAEIRTDIRRDGRPPARRRGRVRGRSTSASPLWSGCCCQRRARRTTDCRTPPVVG